MIRRPRLTILVSLAAALLFAPAGSGRTEGYAIDGDTIRIGRETIRVLNIDTPEIHQAKCPEEKAAGLAAKARTQTLLRRTGKIGLARGDGTRQTDRYGRTLARVYVDGRDLGEILIAEGLARRWTGKRRPWCN